MDLLNESFGGFITLVDRERNLNFVLLENCILLINKKSLTSAQKTFLSKTKLTFDAKSIRIVF